MTLDSALLVAYLAAFMRTSAMALSAPLFTGTGVPVMVRVLFSGALSVALAPALVGHIPIPQDVYELGAMAVQNVVAGLILGSLVQMVMQAAEMAGSFLDMQVGFGLASVLSPNIAMPTSVISRYKYMLAMMLFFSVNGHHLLMNALVGSFSHTASLDMNATFETLLSGIGTISLLAIQIAAPVAAVAFVVDAALGIVSRAVPQINVLMAGISGKMLAGMIALSLALPALVAGVNQGMDVAGDSIQKVFGK